MKRLLVIVFCLVVGLGAFSASAQDQTSTLPSTSRGTFLKLMAVQKLWEEEDYTAAIAELEAYSPEVREDPYEFALINQYLANTAILAGDNNRAKLAVEEALSAGELPPQMKANLDLFYGQLLIGDEEFEKALSHLEDWLGITQTPPLPGQIFYVAYANFMTGNLPRAQTLIERAIEEQPEHSEQWDRVYYQILYDQRKYDAALDVILGLLDRGPANDSYWRLLVNHYMQQEESRNALSAMVIANLQNPMTQEADLKRLVSLYGYVEIPEKAARLLESYIADERVTKDPETLRQLGDLWLMSREREKAKVVLQEAAKVAPDGRTYQLLGGIYFEDEQWEDAYSAYLEALDLGGLTDPDQIRLLVGISAYRAGMTQEARTALEAAAETEEYRSQARSLLRRL
jgi:tetratricopeptide (TPR) repeat protein